VKTANQNLTSSKVIQTNTSEEFPVKIVPAFEKEQIIKGTIASIVIALILVYFIKRKR
jgi:hypothetical protein